ncbi:SH2/SH3 adapter protein Nck1-like [Convolutriloba macropyga]|uniref:SH2/SH3 adapter protein Nck1-like n=1 Tax=Convolutriloba macropyga TaxID=536237 RepID=UPI003F524B2D
MMGREADQVVAKLNYIPSGLHELPLYKGEKLTVVDATGEWWRVKNALGQTGLIPASYIKVNGDSFLSRLFRRSSKGKKAEQKHQQERKQRPNVVPDISTPHSVSQGGCLGSDEKFPPPSGSEDEPKPFQESTLMPKFVNPASNKPSDNYFDTTFENNQTSHHELVDFIAKVRYTYKSQRADELDLKPGEEVTVLERASDGWWRGVNKATQQAGWFPSNYVIQQPFSSFGGGGGGGSEESSKRDSVVCCGGSSSSGANNVANVGAVPLIQGVAISSYQPKNQLELRINQGDQLNILRENGHSSNFWEASNQSTGGQTGLVLKNFVQITTPPSQTTPSPHPHSHAIAMSRNYNGSKSNLSTPLSVSVDSPMKQLQPFGVLLDNERDSLIGAAGAIGGGGSSLVLPFELPPRMGMFKNEEWYFGRVFRTQCEILFKYYGDFGDYLIRDSESNPGDYTLSLKANIKNRHFLIKSISAAAVGGTSRLKIGNKDFPAMGDLLNHYKSNAIFTDVNGSRLVLIKPLRVPGRIT